MITVAASNHLSGPLLIDKSKIVLPKKKKACFYLVLILFFSLNYLILKIGAVDISCAKWWQQHVRRFSLQRGCKWRGILFNVTDGDH